MQAIQNEKSLHSAIHTINNDMIQHARLAKHIIHITTKTQHTASRASQNKQRNGMEKECLWIYNKIDVVDYIIFFYFWMHMYTAQLYSHTHKNNNNEISTLYTAGGVSENKIKPAAIFGMNL